MNLSLTMIMVVVLSIVVYQDHKFRAVNWVLFPLLAILFLTFHAVNGQLMEMLPSILVNLGFLLVTLAVVYLYFSLRQGKLVNLTRDFFGWGDILFLISLALLVGPAFYMFFFIVSLLAAILLVFIKPSLRQSIPFAGIQAAMLVPVLIAHLVWGDLYSIDNYLIGISQF